MEILIGIMLLIVAAFVAVILFILRAFKKEIWEKIKFKEVNMTEDIFKHNRLLKPICEVLTKHNHRRLVGWTSKFSESGYKYANRNDFYYKCKICGYVYFNHRPTKEEIEFIKKYDKEEK